VNAAGAWADLVASLAGVRPVGLVSKKRSIVEVRCSSEFQDHSAPAHDGPLPSQTLTSTRDWPFCVDLDERFYFKPYGRDSLWLSDAANEICEPSDVLCSEKNIAEILERTELFTHLQSKKQKNQPKYAISPTRSWSGLRTFSKDGNFIIGEDPINKNFIWCAGQGGYGMQTSFAVGRITSHIASENTLPSDLLHINLGAISPNRF